MTGSERGAALRVESLTKRFGRGDTQIIAVDGVSLEVPAGHAVAVTGVSGSGKSTLLHLVGGVERADGGQLFVDGTDITALGRGELTAYRRTVGFVFQRFHLLPALSALDNVVAPVLPRRVAFDRTARARELLAAVGLAGREQAQPGQLSGGQQQRVAIARALIARPRLLLADEPTGSLDSTIGKEIMELLLRVAAEHGTTLLVATHEEHVAAACQRVIALRDGTLVADTGAGEADGSLPCKAST